MVHPTVVLQRQVTREQLDMLRDIAQHPPIPWLTEHYEELVPSLLKKLGVTISEEKDGD
jgi:hypothetical protein